MSADADCSPTTGTLSATLPRSFRPSSLLRRRIAGDAEPTNNSGLRLSMPMAGDALDFLDFSAFINNGGAGNGGAGGEENMLQALLSSLPEPPAFTAVSARLGPKLTQRLTMGDSASKPHLGTMMPGSAFGQKHEPVSFDGSLATPASSRRNTDESVDSLSARLQQQPSVDSLTSAASTSDTVGSVVAAELLAAEMPPVSPFFARVSFADIDDARETVRRASLSRQRRRSRTLADSYDRHAASWCAPSSSSTTVPGRLSLAEVTLALRNPSTPPSDELLINQPPPTSPLFAHISPEACRWFRVNVYGLLTSQTARVTVSELNSPHAAIDVTDPAVQKALGRYPLVLALAVRQQQKQETPPANKRPTRMRVPSRRQPSPAVLSAPTLSFTVSTHATAAAADRRVRSVDVDAMAAAYLPHVHALLSESSTDTTVPEDAAAVGECLRTPSQSSTATLAEHCEAEAAKPAPRSLLRRPQRRSDIGVVGSLKGGDAGVMGPLKGDTGLPTPRQLRASASVMNLRGAYAERASAQQSLALRRSTTASISQIAAAPPPTQLPVSRRRSEVQALITQANAVMSSGAVRRSPPDDAAGGPRLLRPPRASFPLYSAPSLALLRSPGTDVAPSGLRAPSSLAAALSRQLHRLEPARELRHSVSSGDLALPLAMLAPVPLRSIGADVLATPRIPRGSTPLSGIRPPPPPPSAPVAASARNAAVAAQPALLSRRPTPHTPLSGRVPGTVRAMAGPPMSAGSSRLRHSGPSSAALRQSFNAPFYDGSDSDEPPAAPSSGMGLRRLTSGSVVRARPGVQALFAGSACDEGFLTLRPVHTPDLVPRTIDPRLIERAMTPMLKTNVGIQYSSLVDLVRSAATITADDDDDLESLPPIHLPTLNEVSPAAEMPQSRFSPINSPERSPVLAPTGGKLSKPGFLARYRSAKPSTAPLPVSAIPLPPATPVQKPAAVPPPQSRALGLSNIPTLRKARSLWAMRSSPAKK